MTHPILGYLAWRSYQTLRDWLRGRHQRPVAREPEIAVDPEKIKRENLEKAIRVDLAELREQIRETGCDSIDSEHGLLRDRMINIFVARKPQTRAEWFEIPLEFRDQTESEQIRGYLSAILFTISRHRKQ